MDRLKIKDFDGYIAINFDKRNRRSVQFEVAYEQKFNTYFPNTNYSLNALDTVIIIHDLNITHWLDTDDIIRISINKDRKHSKLKVFTNGIIYSIDTDYSEIYFDEDGNYYESDNV